MNEDNLSWPPKPAELTAPSQPRNREMVSPIPLGILSCVLIVFLFAANVTLMFYLHQMNLHQKINFIVMHSDINGMLKGAEFVGVPVALLLGILSRHSIAGKAGLFLTGLFLLAVLYVHLFGLPLGFVFGSGK